MSFPSPAARRSAWNQSLAASPGDLDLHIPAASITGRVPPSLSKGRLLSIGPGWNVIDGVRVHPFDGHGYARAFAFQEDGSVRLTARFVQTPSYRAEREAGQIVHRGFATNLPGPFWRNIGFGPPRNVANTTIGPWRDRLLAGWEGGCPYALDADSLATRGEEHFGGLIEGQATLAHWKHDLEQQRLVLCSIAQGRSTRFTFRELDTDEQLVATAEAEIPRMVFTHDFAMSDSWLVLGGNPLRFRFGQLAKMLVGKSDLLHAIAIDPSAPPVFYLVPRGGGPLRTVALPGPAWVVHFGNAFERDGDLIVDACVFHDFAFGEEFGFTGPDTPFDPTRPDERGPQRLYRVTIPAGSDQASWEPLCTYGVDFPRFHPEHQGRPTPGLFGATRADTRFSDPFDSLLRVDLLDPERPPSLWTAQAAFVGEPIFVPDPERPEAGHLLALVSRGLEQRTELVVLDALALEKGPLAVVPLPLLPVAFHGEWQPGR